MRVRLVPGLMTIVIGGLVSMSHAVEKPVLTTAFRRIALTQPDISPYEYTTANNNACDFTIFQAADSTWQLIACIRGTNYPGSNRFLYRWEGTRLDRGEFTPKGILWTTGTKDQPDALGRTLGVNTPYTVEGRLQAPHCVKHNGTFYLFHNNAGAYCLISDDGKTWRQHVDQSGSEHFFDMGRDVMVFDNTAADGKWVAYYTDPGTSPQSVSAKTSSSLDGPWSSTTVRNVYDGKSFLPASSYSNEWAESPFVVRRGDDYYLWIQRYVFHSTDPYKFNTAPVTCYDDDPEWAPEVFSDYTGQEYVAVYKYFGIYVARFEWQSVGTATVMASAPREQRSPASQLSISVRGAVHTFSAQLSAPTVDLFGRQRPYLGAAPGAAARGD